MKKNGFTLIELLAVIVILAVIAIIVTPVVTGIITKTKLSADMRSAEGYVKSAEDYYASSQINEEKKNNIGTNIINKVDVANKIADGILVSSQKGEISMAIIIHNKCYKKDIASNDIVVSDDLEHCNFYQVPPDSCFDTVDIDTNTVKITNYKCGNSSISLSEDNSTSIAFYRVLYDTDGEYPYVIIPSTINGKTVTALGKYAFSPFDSHGNFVANKAVGIVNVIMPDTITKIELNVFESNELSYAKISNNVSLINSSDFRSNKLEKVDFGENITILSTHTFEDNQIKSLVLPNKLKAVFNNAFYNNEIENLTLPDSLTSIAWNAFSFNKLSHVTIPPSVTLMSFPAFNHNLLPDDEAYFYARNDNNKDGKISNDEIDKTTIIGYGGANKDIVLPSNVEKVSSFAFAYCDLKSVVIPNSVKNIDNLAFSDNKITNLTMPSSNIALGEATFNNNMLPDEQAFIYDRSGSNIDDSILVSYGGANHNVVIPEKVKQMKDYSFEYIGIRSNDTIVTIPSTVTNMEQNVFFAYRGTINLDMAKNTIAGSPWGASGASITWLR